MICELNLVMVGIIVQRENVGYQSDGLKTSRRHSQYFTRSCAVWVRLYVFPFGNWKENSTQGPKFRK